MNAVIDVHKLSKCSRPVLRPFFRGAPRYFRAPFPLFFLFFSLAGWFSDNPLNRPPPCSEALPRGFLGTSSEYIGAGSVYVKYLAS